MRYPYAVSPDENGSLVALVPDLPGVLSVGRDGDDARAQATDAVLAMCARLMATGQPIPRPGPARGRPVLALPPMVVMKLPIYDAMREAGVSQTALALRLGCDPRQVRRLLDLDHASRLDQLEVALAALGKRLVVGIGDAA
jgi:antitoxin HicB